MKSEGPYPDAPFASVEKMTEKLWCIVIGGFPVRAGFEQKETCDGMAENINKSATAVWRDGFKAGDETGRESVEKDLKELLVIAELLVSDHLVLCGEHDIEPYIAVRLEYWKKARGIE